MTTAQDFPEATGRYYHRNSIAIILKNAMFSLTRLGISPYTILPFYLKQLTGSIFLIGMVPATYVIGFSLPQLFMANILERTRMCKHILVLSSFVQRVCILGLLLLTLLQPRLTAPVIIGLFFITYLFYNITRGYYSPVWIDFLGRGLSHDCGKIIGVGYFFGGLLNLLASLLLTHLLGILPYFQAILIIFAIAFSVSLVSFVSICSLHDELPAELADGIE